jgi:hypothetical protein
MSLQPSGMQPERRDAHSAFPIVWLRNGNSSTFKQLGMALRRVVGDHDVHVLFLANRYSPPRAKKAGFEQMDPPSKQAAAKDAVKEALKAIVEDQKLVLEDALTALGAEPATEIPEDDPEMKDLLSKQELMSFIQTALEHGYFDYFDPYCQTSIDNFRNALSQLPPFNLDQFFNSFNDNHGRFFQTFNERLEIFRPLVHGFVCAMGREESFIRSLIDDIALEQGMIISHENRIRDLETEIQRFSSSRSVLFHQESWHKKWSVLFLWYRKHLVTYHSPFPLSQVD